MSEFTGACQCANKTFSLRGSPQSPVPKVWPESDLFIHAIGVSFERIVRAHEKQMPQIAENTERSK